MSVWSTLSPEEQRSVLKVAMQGTPNNPANESRARAALSGNADFAHTMMTRAGIGVPSNDGMREDAGEFARAEGVRRNMRSGGGGQRGAVPDGGSAIPATRGTAPRTAPTPARGTSQQAAPDEEAAATSRASAQPSDTEISQRFAEAERGAASQMAGAPVPQPRPQMAADGSGGEAQQIASRVQQDPGLLQQILQILVPGGAAALAGRYASQQMDQFSRSGAGSMGRAGAVDYGGGDPVENMDPQRRIGQERRLALPAPDSGTRSLAAPDTPPQLGGPGDVARLPAPPRQLPAPGGGQDDAMAYLDQLMQDRAADDGMGQASRSAPQQAEAARDAAARRAVRRPRLSAPAILRR